MLHTQPVLLLLPSYTSDSDTRLRDCQTPPTACATTEKLLTAACRNPALLAARNDLLAWCAETFIKKKMKMAQYTACYIFAWMVTASKVPLFLFRCNLTPDLILSFADKIEGIFLNLSFSSPARVSTELHRQMEAPGGEGLCRFHCSFLLRIC